MPTHTFPTAIMKDVEAALIEQYGRTNVKEKAWSESYARWFFRITSKSYGTCVATKAQQGVTLTMSATTHPLLWAITGLGYLCLFFPGIALTVYLFATRSITAGVIAHRFPRMVENVQRITASRAPVAAPPLAAPPPLPSPAPPVIRSP